MPITEKQRIQRAKSLGSSDIAAVLGLDPWRSSYDLWLEKTGKLDIVDQSSPAMEAGTHFEEGVLAVAEQELGKLTRANRRRTRPDLYLHSNIDALVVADQVPVEAKTAGLFSGRAEGWGEPGTDEIPDHYLIQCLVHMLCLGETVELCHVCAFVAGRGFLFYRVPANYELFGVIAERAKDFWERHVLADSPPTDSVPHLDVLRRRLREPKKIISLPATAAMPLVTWNSQKASISNAETTKKAAEREILEAMGDAEVADYGDYGKVTCTWQTRRSIDTKRLKEELPDVAKKYERETRYSVLRYKKASNEDH